MSTIDVKLRAKKASIARIVGPVRATIVLGVTESASAEGACGTRTFSAIDCALGPGRLSFSCQGNR